VTHNLERATSAMEGHRGPVVYYPLVMLVGFFPWSIFVVPAAIDTVQGLRQDPRRRAALRLLLIWLGAYVAVFSLARTKLPNYVLPAYPPLALLTAWHLRQWQAGTTAARLGWSWCAFGVLSAVGALIAVGMPLAAHRWLPGEEVLGLLGLIPLSVGVACLVLMRRQPAAACHTLLAGAGVMALALFGPVQARIDRYQVSGPLVEQIRQDGGAAAPIAAFRDLEPSMVYYADRTVPTLTSVEQVREMFASGEPAYLVLHDQHLPLLLPQLPREVQVLARRPRFFKSGEVVVLVRRSASDATSATGSHATAAQASDAAAAQVSKAARANRVSDAVPPPGDAGNPARPGAGTRSAGIDGAVVH
jgi:4-amino-4-deoxy-L-arabinose transferase-like glycosyltransferase